MRRTANARPRHRSLCPAVTARLRKLSRAVRVVDAETRRLALDARLEALEADNYVEEAAEGEGDEDYFSEDEGAAGGGAARAKKRAAGPAGGAGGGAGAGGRERVKPLSQVLLESGLDVHSSTPNYFTAAAAPSKLPARAMCSVCGFAAPYTCTRCGSKYCDSRCLRQHKEDRCLTFGR